MDPLPYEYAEDHFTDVAGQFKCARGFTHWVWRDGHPEDPEDAFVEVPIEGTFHRELARYRYVINEATKEYYDRMHPANLLGTEEERGTTVYEDLFPLTLSTATGRLFSTGTGKSAREDSRDPFCDGMWIGDVLRPANERPGEGYRDMTHCVEA